MTPEEIAAAEAAKAAADAAKSAEDAKAEADAPKTFDEAYVKSLRAEAKANRLKLEQLEAAEATRKADDEAKKLAEMSELDRLKAQLAETQTKARALEVQAVRSRAAAKHGLPEDLHEFITADDEAGALAQAEKLAALKVKAHETALPPAGGRQPAHTDKPKGFTPEEQRANDRQAAARW